MQASVSTHQQPQFSFADLVRGARGLHDLSQVQLAIRAGASPVRISRIEAGAEPTAEERERLIEALPTLPVVARAITKRARRR